MISRLRKPLLALLMAAYLSFLLTSPSIAGMVGSISSSGFETTQARAEEIEKIQLALENELVIAKLQAYGFTPEEISLKLQEMTDDQINLLAQASDDILAGGDGVGLVIGILVIVLLIILILKLTNKSIVVK
jgi:hypothetical protein